MCNISLSVTLAQIEMVHIELKSQFVSLIFTIANTLAEISLLCALLLTNAFIECRRLQRGERLSIRNHSTRRNLFSIFPIFVFVILEVLTSFFSDPVQIPVNVKAPCLHLDSFTRSKAYLLDFDTSASVELKCLTANKNSFNQGTGRFRYSDNEVQCDKPIFSYHISGINMTKLTDFTFACNDRLCSGVRFRTPYIDFMEAFQLNDLDVLSQNLIVPIIKTHLGDFDANPFVQELAQRLVAVYSRDVSAPSQLRNFVLLGAQNTSCDFQELTDGVSIPVEMLFTVIVLWVVSLASFVLTLPLYRNVFYDMSEPLHWATRTLLPEDPSGQYRALVAAEITRDEQSIHLVHNVMLSS